MTFKCEPITVPLVCDLPEEISNIGEFITVSDENDSLRDVYIDCSKQSCTNLQTATLLLSPIILDLAAELLRLNAHFPAAVLYRGLANKAMRTGDIRAEMYALSLELKALQNVQDEETDSRYRVDEIFERMSEIVELALRSQNMKVVADVAKLQAFALIRAHRNGDALAVLEDTAAAYQSIDDYRNEAKIRFLQGLDLMRTNAGVSAAALKQAIGLFAKVGNKRFQAIAMIRLAECMIATAENEIAKNLLMEADLILDGLGDKSIIRIKTNLDLGDLSLQLRDEKAAMESFDRAERIASDRGSVRWLTQVINKLLTHADELGSDGTIDAVAIYNNVDPYYRIYTTIKRLCGVYHERNEIEPELKMLMFQMRILEQREKDGAKDRIDYKTEREETLSRVFELAVSLTEAKASNGQLDQASHHWNAMASFFEQYGSYERAIECYRRSVQVAGDAVSPEIAADATSQIAILRWAIHDGTANEDAGEDGSIREREPFAMEREILPLLAEAGNREHFADVVGRLLNCDPAQVSLMIETEKFAPLRSALESRGVSISEDHLWKMSSKRNWNGRSINGDVEPLKKN